MSDNTESRRMKERSPNFPFISLDTALQRAQVFYQHERRSSAPQVAAAKHWGYSESSSGFKQTMGALKSYGLLVDEASPHGRLVRLSDSALRILLDTRPDSPDREQFLREAALAPSIASEVFKRWPDDLPSDHTLIHFLVFERGFHEDTAVRAAKILKQNHAHIGRSQSQPPYSDDEESQASMPMMMPTIALTAPTYPTMPGITAANIPSSQQMHDESPYVSRPTVSPALVMPISHHAPTATSSESFRSEKVIDPNGLDVTISFSGEPTQETYEFLADYIGLRLKQFQRKAARFNAGGSDA